MQEWKTREQLENLLCTLSEYPSITGSDDEIAIVQYLYHLLSERDYFIKNEEHLNLHPLDDGRQLLTALVKKDETVSDTIVLLAHIDVVDVEDYGSFINLAFHPRELTKEFHKNPDILPLDARNDLLTGNWLFGRGTMDMKAGLTVHLSLLEKAMNGNFPGNIMLVVVPDEEVNSAGMLASLPVLQEWKQKYELNYVTCLNGEPMFSRYPGDENFYMYMGSIGKVLPGFYCYGKESHVGEPFAGVNANVMTSYINQELELHESFVEKVGEEVTPPPVSLMSRDLKEEYSVQTPIAGISMYNILYMRQSLGDITEKLLDSCYRAKQKIEAHYKTKAKNFSEKAGISYESNVHVNILLYEDLFKEAIKRFGEQEVLRRQNLLINNRDHGDRDFSTLLVQDLAYLCKDLAPMIVLFYSPPFYPSVSSKENTLIQDVTKEIQREIEKSYDMKLEAVEFFPGLSDLSYIGSPAADMQTTLLEQNMPIHNKGYTLNTEAMNEVSMPVLNIGPLGKDPHQWTERLELTYTFEKLPVILEKTIHHIFSMKK
ncbi:arginine utilization protein RocB [Salirhabdus euzebyi]|uniref:Arginine utilization protein RocB n=1 Tax=Salirhabdus euzebyi TaxID=394506 RepID=A0A841QAN3_9BACI|nr:M20/M25/M40 family metallo-hydrolase [Salirhabdus euzebyi]MBB6455343.1 arginine utilization protein RocB [Salirhabdus euzebyi]